jgi:hypothetical protein
MHKKSALNYKITYWMIGQLQDVKGDVTLRRINELSLLLSIYNICYVVVSLRGWWKMLTQTIRGVAARIRYKWCHHLDR